MKKKYIIIAIFALAAVFFITHFFLSKPPESTTHYGVKANELRKKLHIPLIDGDMYEKTDYNGNGNRWNNKRKEPKGSEVLHTWKNIIPLTEKAGLNLETDAYQKKVNDTLIYQLEIESRVLGDTAATRTGRLFPLEKMPEYIELNDQQVDSVARLWGLTELVRNK